MDEILETGVYCKDCCWFEPVDVNEQGDCNACGCSKDMHVKAHVVVAE